MLITGGPLTLQPDQVVPAAAYPGLRNFWNFGDQSGRCLITGAMMSRPGNLSALTWVQGGLKLDIKGWDTTPATLPLAIDANAPITMVVGVLRTSASGVNWSLMNPNWDGFYQDGTGLLSTNNTDFSGSVTPTAGPRQHRAVDYYALTMSGANDLRAARNGGPVAQDTSCAVPTPTSPNSTFRLGSDAANANKSDIIVSLVAIIQRAVSSAELIALSRDPWGLLFAPRRIWVPVSAGGGGAITIDGVVGNAVAAGVTGVAGVAATINGVVGNATAAGITGTVSVDLSIAGVVGNAVAAGVTGAPAVSISIDGVLGNAVAAGVSGVPGVSIEIAGTVGNAVAAGVAGLAEVGGSISIDGVVGNAVAAGVAGSPGVAITITGNVGNAVAAGVTGQADVGILIDGVVGNATAAGVTGGLSLDIVVVGVVGNAAAAGVTGAVSLSGGSGADPADVWAYELAPGVSAGQYVTEIHAMLTTLTGGSVVLPVNVKQVNDKIIYGNGIPGSDVFRVTP